MNYARLGNVDDIRNSLRFISPTTDFERDKSIKDLQESIAWERKYKVRSSVIKLLQVKMKNLRNLKF